MDQFHIALSVHFGYTSLALTIALVQYNESEMIGRELYQAELVKKRGYGVSDLGPLYNL